MYDISDRETYDSIEEFWDMKERNARENIVSMLIGNKCDLEQQRRVTKVEGKKYAGEKCLMSRGSFNMTASHKTQAESPDHLIRNSSLNI